jgi:organic hydroperoxide reductase OsmC/OhrA
MSGQAHQYETTVEWKNERRGALAAAGRPSLPIGAPTEFGGTDDIWSPEHLCVAAVNACIMLTFIAVAGNSKVPFRAYRAAAVGTLEHVDGRGYVITRIVVKPTVTVAADTDRAKLARVFAITEKHCFISNSLNAVVTVEPEVVTDSP